MRPVPKFLKLSIYFEINSFPGPGTSKIIEKSFFFRIFRYIFQHIRDPIRTKKWIRTGTRRGAKPCAKTKTATVTSKDNDKHMGNDLDNKSCGCPMALWLFNGCSLVAFSVLSSGSLVVALSWLSSVVVGNSHKM